MLQFRKFLTEPVIAWGILDLSLLAGGWAMTDVNFQKIITKPDNVPIVLLIFSVGFFTWLALHRAVLNDDRIRRGEPPLEKIEDDKVLVWPDLVYTELIAMVVVTFALVIWAIVLKAPLEQPASPARIPNPSKAPWYFLGLQEMLVYYDPWMAGVVLPSMIIVGLIAMPFIDYNPKRQRLLHLRAAQIRRVDVAVRLPGFMGNADRAGHFPPRSQLEFFRPIRGLGCPQKRAAEQSQSFRDVLDD